MGSESMVCILFSYPVPVHPPFAPQPSLTSSTFLSHLQWIIPILPSFFISHFLMSFPQLLSFFLSPFAHCAVPSLPLPSHLIFIAPFPILPYCLPSCPSPLPHFSSFLQFPGSKKRLQRIQAPGVAMGQLRSDTVEGHQSRMARTGW